MTEAESLQSFAALVARRPVPLLDVAAELPRYLVDDIDPAATVQTVRQWAECLAARIPADTSALNRLRLLNHFFFDELAFHPNVTHYSEIDNSLLQRVVVRRTGIPITLALLYIEIGRAAGLTLHGVGFPGHFLVRVSLGEGAMFIDVFARGAALSAESLQARLAAALNGAVEYPLAVYLRPASELDIVARMLRNLKMIHVDGGDLAAALRVQDRLVAVRPDAADERRARAALYERLECPRAAAQDLADYLAMSRDPHDAGALRERLQQLQQAAGRLN
jgi:regulator of sirC expression with transglutaminase-like and TPR domain